MKVVRVFNNNVVLAQDAGGGEVVLTGRGLGFQARPGQQVDPAKIVQTFVPTDGREPGVLGALLAEIPPEHIALAQEALAEVGDAAGSGTLVALADHLSFAIKRHRQGLQLEYPLQAEVAHLYPDELARARRILAVVNRRLDAQHTPQLPSAEAVPIALHLVNAGFATGDLSLTYTMTGVLGQLFEVVEQTYGRSFDTSDVNAARFITHLRYFFVRARTGRQLHNGQLAFGTAMRTAYPEAYACALRLRAVLELRLDHPVSEDEVTYLTMHVARLTTPDRDG